MMVSLEDQDLKHTVSSPVCFIPLSECFNLKDSNIPPIISKFEITKDLSTQQECIKSLASCYFDDSKNEEKRNTALQIVSFIFLTTSPKHSVNKSLNRLLRKLDSSSSLEEALEKGINLILNYVKSHIAANKESSLQDECITSLSTKCSLKSVHKALSKNINVVFNFTFGRLLDLVDMLWNRKQCAIKNESHLKASIYNCLKLILDCLSSEKDYLNQITDEDKKEIVKCCYKIITFKEMTHEIQTLCGHVMVLVFTVLPEYCKHKSNYPAYPIFDFFLSESDDNPTFEVFNVRLKDLEDVATLKISIYGAIAVIMNSHSLCELKINTEPILIVMLKELLEYATRHKLNPSQKLAVSKTIADLSTHLKHLQHDMLDAIVNLCLNYFVFFLDDPLETVKKNTKKLFEELIKQAVLILNETDLGLLSSIIQWMNDLPNCDIYYIAVIALCNYSSCSLVLKMIPGLPCMLLKQIENTSKANVVSTCYETLMQKHLQEVKSVDKWIDCWVKEILKAFKSSSTSAAATHMQNLFKKAFELHPLALKALLSNRYFDTDCEMKSFLGCIHIARKKGIQLPEEIYQEISIKSCWRNLVPYSTLEIYLNHQNDDVRLLALAIIVESHKTTETFTEVELKWIYKFLFYNINTQTTSTRSNILYYFKKVMHRLIDSEKLALKKAQLPNQKPSVDLPSTITSLYSKFWDRITVEILLFSLNPDCSYARRTASLELLVYVYDNLKKYELYHHITRQNIVNLKYILHYDTYEKNKNMSIKILEIFNQQPELLALETKSAVKTHIKRYLTLASSIKPAHTISAAYLLSLCRNLTGTSDAVKELFKELDEDYSYDSVANNVYTLLMFILLQLQKCYAVGESNLQKAASSKPIHGYIFCIRHILTVESLSKTVQSKHWRIFFRDLIYWCLKLGKLVEVIICNQSPEGYLPEDCSDECTEMDETAKAQMVTVYGWRAAKEISLLLGDVVMDFPFFGPEYPLGIVDEEQIQAIGEYFFNLLINTKHRGAFEQAALGFTSFCSKLWKVPCNKINQLPNQWLKKILGIIVGEVEENFETCATRRSAGLPFMIQAILISEPGSQHIYFHNTMKMLLKVATNKSRPDEQRIHSLNILRTLYRHNQLSEVVMPYCAEGLMISTEGFGSKNWGIRNASTLLFATLMNRVFGVLRSKDEEKISTKNTFVAQVFFTKYPELYSFLLNELKKGVLKKEYPTLFPALLIINRLYIAKGCTGFYKMAEYKQYIFACLCNPVYRVREVAARTYSNLTLLEETANVVKSCLVVLSNINISVTFCHGVLLLLQQVLKVVDIKENYLNMSKIIDGTAWILVCAVKGSHLNGALYLEILTDLIVRYDLFQDCEVFKKLISIFRWLTRIQTVNENSLAFDTYNALVCCMKIYVFVHILRHHNISVEIFENWCFINYILDDVVKYAEVKHLMISYCNYFEYTDFYEVEDDYEFFYLMKKYIAPLSRYQRKVFVYTVQEILKNFVLKEKPFENIGNTSVLKSFYMQLLHIHAFQSLLNQHDTLTSLLDTCNSPHELIVCSAIARLDAFLSELMNSEETEIDFKANDIFDVVLKHSLPHNQLIYRLTACRFLLNHKSFFAFNHEVVTGWTNVCLLWKAVFVLLEDDNDEVRNNICSLCEQNRLEKENHLFVPTTKKNIPNYTRNLMLSCMVETIPITCSITILLSLIFRGKSTSNKNLSEIFEEGVSNTCIDFYPTATVAATTLSQLLWKLDDGMSFEDKSIFVEEHLLLITRLLYDKFIKNSVPSIFDNLSSTLKNILAKILLFLEKVPINQSNFKDTFKNVIDGALNTYFVKELEIAEMIRLRLFFNSIYLIPVSQT